MKIIEWLHRAHFEEAKAGRRRRRRRKKRSKENRRKKKESTVFYCTQRDECTSSKKERNEKYSVFFCEEFRLLRCRSRVRSKVGKRKIFVFHFVRIIFTQFSFSLRSLLLLLCFTKIRFVCDTYFREKKKVECLMCSSRD
jgi:hypothetical protein